MKLRLNEEQQMLQDSAAEFLQQRAPVAHLRAVRDEAMAGGYDPALWQEMVELGWSAILVEEAYGGLEYGYSGLGIVLEQCGRHLTPSPLRSTSLMAVSAIQTFGDRDQKTRLLGAICAGESTMAVALDETARRDQWRCDTKAEPTDGGFRITGMKCAVWDGAGAGHFLVLANTPSGLGLFVVPSDADGVQLEDDGALDISHAPTIQLNSVEVDKSAWLGQKHVTAEHIDRLMDIGCIGAAAEMLGLADQAFKLTLDYLRNRKQFGITISHFQALQHRAAALYTELELGRSLLRAALWSLDQPEGLSPSMASMTKAKLGVISHTAAAEGIQMHGGIGMTDDYEIGFYLKRWKILDAMYGDSYFHFDRYSAGQGY